MLFSQNDQLQIENILYTVRLEEMVARRVFKMNTNYAPFASEIGYDWYTRTGRAKVFARGGTATDVPFVGEKGGRETQTVFDILSGFEFSKAEQDAMKAKAAYGKGPTISIDELRISACRRFLYEEENICAFVGNSDVGIKGVFNAAWYGTDKGTKETVATGATSSSVVWSGKTPKEILTDLRTGVAAVERKGLYKARILLLPPDALTILRQPYSDLSPMTILDWIFSQGMYFEEVIATSVMSAPYNGDTTDWFMILDNDPEVVELATPQDIVMENPVFDLIGTYKQAVRIRTAGPIVRHPAGFYIGTGIGT